MKRVLIIAAVLVLFLCLFVLWLATGPGPGPGDGLADKPAGENQKPVAPHTEVADQKRNEPAGNETPPPPPAETIPAAGTPEGDSGFRPITGTGAPEQTRGSAEATSERQSTPAIGDEGLNTTGTMPSGPSNQSREALSDAASTPPDVQAGPPPTGEPAKPAPEPEPETVARVPEQPAAGTPSAKTTEPKPSVRERATQTAPAGPALSQNAPEPFRRRPAPPGRYETITTATARSRPSDTAPIVDRISRGTFLNVTGSEGDWLIVYSTRKNVTVFVKRDEAMLAKEGPLTATGVPESDWPRVERAILDALARNDVTGVQVTFIADTAYLKGTVKTEAERERAEIFARSILEVKHVFNGIRVE